MKIGIFTGEKGTDGIGLLPGCVPVKIGQRTVIKTFGGGAGMYLFVAHPAGIDDPAIFVLHRINSFRCSRDGPMSAHPGGVAGLAPAAADAVGLADHAPRRRSVFVVGIRPRDSVSV